MIQLWALTERGAALIRMLLERDALPASLTKIYSAFLPEILDSNSQYHDCETVVNAHIAVLTAAKHFHVCRASPYAAG